MRSDNRFRREAGIRKEMVLGKSVEFVTMVMKRQEVSV